MSDFPDFSADPWSVPEAFLVPGARVAERYALDERIAQGGMGTIWAALDTTLDRRVAVKFLAPGLVEDATLRERFDREARAVATLRTPHVATVFDHGVERGLPFIVMELLEGEDLQRRLAREHRLDLATTSRIVSQVARALAVAHEAGTIHRDLKSENVFLARSVDDPSGELVKVLDFGVARLLGAPRATGAGIVVGSPHTMSPEQMRGAADLDGRSDVWALGVITHEMLTGTRPFDGTLPEIASQITRGLEHLATTQQPDLPSAIDGFFARAFAVDRRARFGTAIELAETLEHIAASSPAPPPPPAPALVEVAPLAPTERRLSIRVEEDTPRAIDAPSALEATPLATAPRSWVPLVGGLCAVLVVLLAIALLWSP